MTGGGWFRLGAPAPGVILATEPAVHPFFRANLYTLRGRDCDLQVDFGCGIAPLRPVLGGDRPVIAVATHAHVDHVGGLHEFPDRRGHAAEAATFATMEEQGTLQSRLRDQIYGRSLRRRPGPGFRLKDWALVPAPLTALLAEGDRLDLGDRAFSVLHLPGHSPGSIALLDEAAGLLVAGDAVYDDELVDDIPGADVGAYCATMERLRHLDCALVLGGHGRPFGRARLRAIAEAHLRARGA